MTETNSLLAIVTALIGVLGTVMTFLYGRIRELEKGQRECHDARNADALSLGALKAEVAFLELQVSRYSGMPTSMQVRTDAAGKILNVIGQSMQLLGYAAIDLIGKPCRMLVAHKYHPAHDAKFEERAADPLAKSGVALVRSAIASHHSGADVPVIVQVREEMSESGQKEFIADITAQRIPHAA